MLNDDFLKPSRTPYRRRSPDLISNHAKSLETFILGVEDDHSSLKIAVDAVKPV
jgi:hypothetical protein